MDQMQTNLEEPLAGEVNSIRLGQLTASEQMASDKSNRNDNICFAIIMGSFQVTLMVLFGFFVEYKNPKAFDAQEQIQYIFYLDVTIMMVVGFGFLMTFMRKYALGAIGLTFLITAMTIPWGAITGQFFQDACYAVNGDNNGTDWDKLSIGTDALLQGNFGAAAVLISFGAVIGKVSPSQVAAMCILETVFYQFNKQILNLCWLETLDMGGTIFIHLFGAYFGLAVSMVIGNRYNRERASEDAEASQVSDVFSLVGTTFLWIFWPSFNGATAAEGVNTQEYTTTNTVLALSASCCWTFILSRLLNKDKVSTVDIQNATLAGGVAVGAASNMGLGPVWAMVIGFGSAVVSCLGFNLLQGFLEQKIGLHDSCGVHNLHGMPAIFGTVCVAIASMWHNDSYPRGVNQPGYQLAGAAVTLVVSTVSGAGVGVILRFLPSPVAPFRDDLYWTVAKVEGDKKDS